jgi:hypothetical protein
MEYKEFDINTKQAFYTLQYILGLLNENNVHGLASIHGLGVILRGTLNEYFKLLSDHLKEGGYDVSVMKLETYFQQGFNQIEGPKKND